DDLFFCETFLHVQSPCHGGLDSKVTCYSIPGGRREKDTLESMMDPAIESAIIGYDRRSFEFPLKATGISFADSVDHPALQLADLIAGATMYWASWLTREGNDEFADSLEAAGIRRFVFQTVWPSEDVTPETLGTTEVGGINAVEHMTNALSGLKFR
ncbi:DUF3800 domain-containing protein, partial [Vogesella amnigena]